MLEKPVGDGIKYTSPAFRAKQDVILYKDEILEALDESLPILQEHREKFTTPGSGWV